ncbi:hypothetical protein LXL04_020125 [Taraxacum kok-saghyz]
MNQNFTPSRSPLRLPKKTCFETTLESKPSLQPTIVFGCTCFVLKPHVERKKLSSKSALCVFLGYGIGQKGYRCYDPSTQKLYVSRNVTFLEHIPFYSIPVQSHDATREELHDIDPFSIDIDDPPPADDTPPTTDPPPIVDPPTAANPPHMS